MTVPSSLRCLLRPSPAAIPRQVTAAATTSATWSPPICAAPFSTTCVNLVGKNAQKKGANTVGWVSKAGGKRMAPLRFRGKKVETRQGKSPLPGERKAMRKRILLSNNSALPVPGLADLGAGDMLSEGSVGKMMSLPGQLQDQLRTIEAFKSSQFWPMFRQPSTLIRSETVNLATRMQRAASSKDTLRLVVDGDRITGKSLLLLQTQAHAFLNDWIVIHIPEAQELTTACTEYAPIPETDPVQYMQNNYCLRLLQNIRKANERVLSRVTTAYSHADLPQNIPANSTLLQLTNSAKEPDGAWNVFQALWKELMYKGSTRPPVLFTLDGLQHIMKVSDYRSPAFELIHSQDLALVRIFADALSGATPLPGGGAILAATTYGNAPRSPSMDLALAQRVAAQNGEKGPAADPYCRKYDPRSEAALKTVDVLRLKGLSKAEARSLMEYWALSGLLRTTVDETAVAEKWVLGGHGVVGEMERASLLTMRL